MPVELEGIGMYKLMEMNEISLMQSCSSSRKSGPFSDQLPPIWFSVPSSVWFRLIPAVCGDYVGYPRPSVYNKLAHFSLTVNGTYMYTVSYAGYDYVQLSMDEGYLTEFRIAVTDQP